ncbi:hypothetical protein AVEN_45823-1 [Araneus ventricosus]|uniref:Uncharacterized protein n=1 Tax=Araneus ventricosus TaxID=182803 RepID=A0A4Y2J659_ARAVE|nr:hypothetical protein AVEN_45823-1 [Araneus ventricosus]
MGCIYIFKCYEKPPMLTKEILSTIRLGPSSHMLKFQLSLKLFKDLNWFDKREAALLYGTLRNFIAWTVAVIRGVVIIGSSHNWCRWKCLEETGLFGIFSLGHFQ